MSHKLVPSSKTWRQHRTKNNLDLLVSENKIHITATQDADSSATCKFIQMLSFFPFFFSEKDLVISCWGSGTLLNQIWYKTSFLTGQIDHLHSTKMMLEVAYFAAAQNKRGQYQSVNHVSCCRLCSPQPLLLLMYLSTIPNCLFCSSRLA